MTAARLHFGWQYASLWPDPGPPPRRPTPPEPDRIDPGWLAAQRREENLLNRPLKAACGGSAAITAVLAVSGLAGWLNALVAALGAACAALLTALSGHAIWQGERALRSRIDAERSRVSGLRADTERKLFGWQAEHAARVRAWQAHRAAYEQQKRWYAVTAPSGVQRVDVAGGTLTGWSAMLTTAGAYLLAGGGQVTVLDLTESAVALDLIAFASAGQSRVRVLPDDLPALDPGLGLVPGGFSLDGRALADVLALTVSATEEHGSTRDLSSDSAILERVIGILGDGATIAGVTAALRTLAQIGDPADDVAAGLIDADQVDRVRTAFGAGAASRVVIDRAWTLAAQLRTLAALGTGHSLDGQTPLNVLALSRRAAALDGKVLAAYLPVSLAHVLRQAGPGDGRTGAGDGRAHTVFVLAAERLRADVLDRLSDACERTGTGLVLAYRDLSPPVRQRLGRGDAAIAFMRLGNAEDAKAASEQIGTEHRFVLSQLTETVGESVTDTTTGSYTSTAGYTGSVTASESVSESTSFGTSHGSSAERGVLPLGRATASRGVQATDSRTDGTAESVTAGLSLSTSWGQSTSFAVGASESMAYAAQRSREFLVEQYELQRLPASAMILSYAGPAGRELVLTDVNPGIGALSSATMHTLSESLSMAPGQPPPLPTSGQLPPVPTSGQLPPEALPPAPLEQPAASAQRSRFGTEPPNLGPPPPRLDWRRKRLSERAGGTPAGGVPFAISRSASCCAASVTQTPGTPAAWPVRRNNAETCRSAETSASCTTIRSPRSGKTPHYLAPRQLPARLPWLV